MFLITSAAYVLPELVSEFGLLPPSMLPVQNRRLFEHQLALVPKGEKIILSLPQSYQADSCDLELLNVLGVSVVSVPDGLSLGESIINVLRNVNCCNEPIRILHGDTLFRSLPTELDAYTVAFAEDDYSWDSTDDRGGVFSGFFAFSDQLLLLSKITENGYDFISGVKAYGSIHPLRACALSDWMDFGLSNSYFRSISKLTTQRAFNSMAISRFSVKKSSSDIKKMLAEANWILSLPKEMKHYCPPVWDQGLDSSSAFYEIEYYYLSSLSSLFVFGRNTASAWKRIISSCIEYLNLEFSYKPKDIDTVAAGNASLYFPKTIARLRQFSEQTTIDFDHDWVINGEMVPSINTILREINSSFIGDDPRFVGIMHGDPCFSNTLYDFKSASIKLIDPRGFDNDGNMSLFGDIRYDVAKLAHSIIGMYDFIIAERYKYFKISDYHIELSFEASDSILEAQNFFLKQSIGGYSIHDLSVFPIMIHLFLSMLPLHADQPKRQEAMLANALRLYQQYQKETV